MAILAKHHDPLVPDEAIKSLNTFKGEHIYEIATFSPAYDYALHVTSWLATNISIGAESFDENVIGGSSVDTTQFNPAVVQWGHESGIGFISV
jgi:hypothetical protein